MKYSKFSLLLHYYVIKASNTYKKCTCLFSLEKEKKTTTKQTETEQRRLLKCENYIEFEESYFYCYYYLFLFFFSHFHSYTFTYNLWCFKPIFLLLLFCYTAVTFCCVIFSPLLSCTSQNSFLINLFFIFFYILLLHFMCRIQTKAVSIIYSSMDALLCIIWFVMLLD